MRQSYELQRAWHERFRTAGEPCQGASCRLPWGHRAVEKNLTACNRAWSVPDVCTVPCVPASMWKMRGDFSVGGARLCFRIPENPCSPRPAVAGRANPLPPVADFGMKEVRTKKKKHMTKDVNGMKKKRGRPALGRTRKLTKGVTVKFSPVSYEALRFRAGKSGRSLAVYIREAALAATVTARHTPEENALLRSLAGMANNLNQLTKLSHQTGFYRTKLLIEGLLGKLKRIMNDYRPKGE